MAGMKKMRGEDHVKFDLDPLGVFQIHVSLEQNTAGNYLVIRPENGRKRLRMVMGDHGQLYVDLNK